jgi:hypothetical protein
MRYEVLTAVIMKISCIHGCGATYSSRSLLIYQRNILHLCSPLKMEAAYASEMLKFYQITWHHIPEKSYLQDDELSLCCSPYKQNRIVLTILLKSMLASF